MAFYGSTFGGATWNSFVNANNFSSGCVLDGRRVDCNELKQLFDDGLVDFSISSGLTESTRFDPQRPPGYFETRGEFGHDRFFITGPIFGPDPQNTEVLTVDPDGIRSALDRMLRTGGCGQFVEDLINRLGAKTKNPFISDYALDLFDAVAGGKGGFIRGGLANKNRVGATVSGDIRSGDAAIHLTSHFNGPPVGNSVNFIDAFQTLHELVHLAGRSGYYDDQQVAETLFKMTGSPGLPDRKDYKSKNDFIGANSAYFSKVLSSKCPVLSR
jgi:hypothetical protein